MDLPTRYKAFNIVEVRFKGSRKDFYINHENHYLEMGDMVVTETATGGYDIGHVSLSGELVRMQIKKRHVKMDDIVKKIMRKATTADVDKWKAAKDLEWETMHKARTLALNLGLSMKLSDVDYQGDKTKATFYYTAEGRVDFRELIKKMAEAFRIRIEMRQIGMRQEASRLGGIGSCGRELCCSTWLTDFKTVSTSAARYQNLSLNTLKLAGQCGKLKCCLNYELDTYMDALKDIPENVDRLETEKGYARLQKTDIFKKLMWFSYPNEESWIPLTIARVMEIQEMNKNGEKPEDLKEEAAEIAPVSVAKVLDYENVVGQDSITRLDERQTKKKKKKRPSSRRGNDEAAEGQRNTKSVEQNNARRSSGSSVNGNRNGKQGEQNNAKNASRESEARQQNNSRQPQTRSQSEEEKSDNTQQPKKQHGPRHFKRKNNNNKPKGEKKD